MACIHHFLQLRVELVLREPLFEVELLNFYNLSKVNILVVLRFSHPDLQLNFFLVVEKDSVFSFFQVLELDVNAITLTFCLEFVSLDVQVLLQSLILINCRLKLVNRSVNVILFASYLFFLILVLSIIVIFGVSDGEFRI